MTTGLPGSELVAYPETMTERLDYWARHASYRTFLAERDARGHWRNVTYAEVQFFALRIGQALLEEREQLGRRTLGLMTRDAT